MKTTWAEALDASLQAVLDGQATLEECLARYPQHSRRLAEVLPAALATREALHPPPPQKPARLPASLEARLRAVAARQRNRPQAFRVLPALRPSAVLAALLIVALLLGATTAAARAAQRALPRDTLYPVKRGLEEVQLLLSRTQADDAALLEAFALRRLEEIEALAAAGREEDLAAGLAEYEANVSRLLQVVGEVPAEDGPGSLTHIEQSLSHHLEVLERVRDQAPEEAQQGLNRALENSRRGREVISEVLHGGGQGREQTPGQGNPDRPKDKPEDRNPGHPQRTPGPPPRRPPSSPTSP